MNELLTTGILIAFVLGVLGATMPLLIAAVGEVVGESSGVLNLGIEGVMLIGAFVGFVVTLGTGFGWLGFAAAALAGVLSSLPMLLAVVLGLNQIVVGLAVYLAGLGLTSVFYENWLSGENPRIVPQALWMLILGIALTAVVAWWMDRTSAGLRLRAAGFNPQALDVAGHSVTRVRASAVLFGGATAGLAGAYLSVAVVGSFTPAMTHGIGFLAIVLVMISRGKVWVTALGALLLGILVSLSTAVQLVGISIPNDLVAIVPFVLIVVLLSVPRFCTPSLAALGNAYTRGATR